VIAGHVEHRNVEAADQVLEVVERQVSASEDDVRPDRIQLVAVEALVDLVGDREDTRGLHALEAERGLGVARAGPQLGEKTTGGVEDHMLSVGTH
jgi:hypothetical protein